MDPEMIGVFIPILAIFGFFGLMGFKAWSNHQLRMREKPGAADDQLAEAVQQLHDEIALIRDDVAELHERMDFTERVLSDVRSRNAIGPGDAK